MSEPAPPNNPTPDQILLAHHKAAQAVVQYRVTDNAIWAITILPSTTSTEAAFGAIPRVHETERVCSGKMAACSARILSYYAGGHAQRRCDPQTADNGSHVDDEIADGIRRECGWEHREQEFRDRSRDLVVQHWSEIVAVATELLKVQTLDWFEVELIADVARGATFVKGNLKSALAMFRASRERWRVMATTGTGLQPDDEIKCSVCGEVHVVQPLSSLADMSTAEAVMLYAYCTKPRFGVYYVGSIGGQSNRGPVVKRADPKGGA